MQLGPSRRPPSVLSSWDPPSDSKFWDEGVLHESCHRWGVPHAESRQAPTVGYAVIWPSQKSALSLSSSKILMQQWHSNSHKSPTSPDPHNKCIKGTDSPGQCHRTQKWQSESWKPSFPWVLVSWWCILSTGELLRAVDFSEAISIFSQWLAFGWFFIPTCLQAGLTSTQTYPWHKKAFPCSPSSSPSGMGNVEILYPI